MRQQHKQLVRRQQSARRGAALVEMAVVAPLFLLFILGIIEFGRAMMVSQLVTNAARDGARVAAADGSTTNGVETAVQQFLTTSLGLDAADINVTITVTAGPGNPDPGNSLANSLPGDKCTVNVAIPFDKVALTKPDWLGNKTLNGYCAMRREW